MTNASLRVYIVKKARRDHHMEIFNERAMRNTRILESLVCLEIDVFLIKEISRTTLRPQDVHGKGPVKLI